MREEDVGMRYLSPLVKQDLAKLDKDGESRRIALTSLKQYVEQLDAGSMARFLTQVAESRDSGGSRAYAISLYEEVARVHGKLIIPYIPRVMISIIRSLTASGSLPQLQQSCAKVVAAVARYTIDYKTSPEEAEDIIRELCDPLTEALAGKLEPVAAGSAACVHALVESENWKYASDETVHEVCQRTTVALSEKSTRTVTHMQLVRALASVNPDTLSIYGASLLRAGEEILPVTSNSWQHRKAAAKLLQAVLTILDKETLDTELDSALHALDSCRLDRMPHVRVAVSEALHTAKMLASGDPTRNPIGLMESPIRKTTERGRSTSNGDTLMSPMSKRVASPTSQESHHLSFSPASTSTSESMHHVQVPSPAASVGRRAKRAPLFPARGMGFTHSPRSTTTTSPSSSTTSNSDTHLCGQDAKENVPARSAAVNGVGASEDNQGNGPNGKYSRPRAPPTPDSYTRLLPSQLDKFGVELQVEGTNSYGLKEELSDYPDTEVTAREVSNATDEISRQMTPLVSKIMSELTETTSIMQEDDELLSCIPMSGAAVEEVSHVRTNVGSALDVLLPRLRLGSNGNASPDSILQSEYVVRGGASTSSFASNGSQNNGTGQIDSRNLSTKDCTNDGVKVAKRQVGPTGVPNNTKSLANGHEGSQEMEMVEGSPISRVNLLSNHYNALAHLDVSPEEKSRSFITTTDFLPFSTPKKLMRALQSNLSSPDSSGSVLDRDLKPPEDDIVVSGSTGHNPDVVDMEVETSSEAGWSVRDNPIASDESFRDDSSDDEPEARGRGGYEAFAFPRKVSSADGVSPREIHMETSPIYRKTRSVDNVSALESENREHLGVNHKETLKGARSVHIFGGSKATNETCSSCGLESEKPSVCRMRAPSRAGKEMEFETGKSISSRSGLPSLLQEEDSKRNRLCNACWGGSDWSMAGESAEEGEVDSLLRTSVGKKSGNWWERGIGHLLVVRFAKRNWRSVCWYSEIFLGGSLCVVLALPLAMAVAKALSAPRDYTLVPT